ncbi:hypothetical protein CPB83DRAFT_879637 [Crepidotus variabilis]|uniref:Uncharacterized protein n=1 Tax=Crepidotus variabilis TaxID=179855 RepID=A0A9P6ESS0_9AGAR|nr:hypothetical protein CPB83DRAFT_879637 [Crepidotus variabilis]
MSPFPVLLHALFGGSVFAPRKCIHVYNQLVWWSFFACTVLFLRAFFGLGTFEDLALTKSSVNTFGRNRNNGEIPGALDHAPSPKSTLLRERMSTQDLVDNSAAQFVAGIIANSTAVTEEAKNTFSRDCRASSGESLESHCMSLSPRRGGDQNEELGESFSKLASLSMDTSDDEDPFSTHFTSGNMDYTIDITTPESRRYLGDESSQREPFLSFEEFDQGSSNFALKILLESSYPLAVSVTLGEDEICEGSRGIKCLPEE